MTRETRLLDAIEDAEHDLAHARMVRRWWRVCAVVLAVVGAGMIATGLLIGGDARAGLIITAVALLLFGSGALIIWAVDGDVHTDVASCEHRLRKAYRAHRDHLLGADQ